MDETYQHASGDIWDVPPIPHREFWDLPPDIFRAAEPLLGGYPVRCRDACALCRVANEPGWLNAKTGKIANELGAPVGQALRVAQVRTASCAGDAYR